MAPLYRKDDDEGETFLRRFVVPEEDRHLFTTTPWTGGFRWFRSANILPLERYRHLKTKSQPIPDRKRLS